MDNFQEGDEVYLKPKHTKDPSLTSIGLIPNKVFIVKEVENVGKNLLACGHTFLGNDQVCTVGGICKDCSYNQHQGIASRKKTVFISDLVDHSQWITIETEGGQTHKFSGTYFQKVQ